MSDLVQEYERSLPIWMHEDGFSGPPLLALHHNGDTSMATLMIPNGLIFRTVMTQVMTDLTIKEIIFGVDRYTKPGQGTKYKDVLTVFWWQGERQLSPAAAYPHRANRLEQRVLERHHAQDSTGLLSRCHREDR